MARSTLSLAHKTNNGFYAWFELVRCQDGELEWGLGILPAKPITDCERDLYWSGVGVVVKDLLQSS